VRAQAGTTRLVECTLPRAASSQPDTCALPATSPTGACSTAADGSPRKWRASAGSPAASRTIQQPADRHPRYTELLLGTRSETEPDRHDLEEIRSGGKRAADLTQQLLAFSRKQVLMPKDVDLNHAIVSLQTMLSRLFGRTSSSRASWHRRLP
jgi:hypothetical protein